MDRLTNKREVAGESEVRNIPEIATMPNGLRTQGYTRGIVTQRDPISGVVCYVYLPRPFVMCETWRDGRGEEREFAARALSIPTRYRVHESVDVGKIRTVGPRVLAQIDSVRLAVFVPGRGLLINGSDILPAARRAAERFFPKGQHVPIAELDAIFASFEPRFAFEPLDI